MAQQLGEFEKQLKRLQEIVSQLEQGELSLEQGVALFKEGCELAKACQDQLKTAKHKVEIYSQGTLQEFKVEEKNNNESYSDETET